MYSAYAPYVEEMCFDEEQGRQDRQLVVADVARPDAGDEGQLDAAEWQPVEDEEQQLVEDAGQPHEAGADFDRPLQDDYRQPEPYV